MAIQIQHSVIHGFEKIQHTLAIASITKKNILLNAELPTVINLIEGISNLLGRRQNAQSWGRFDSLNRAGPYRQKLLEHTENPSDINSFLLTTHLAMDEIVAKAALKHASTGSHILFAQFTDEGGLDRMLVAMIKQKGGIQLDMNYVPIGIVAIDMSKLSQAADIRIQRFIDNSDYDADNDEDEDEEEPENYLSFLSQRDSEDASSYFVEALGCVVGISSKKATCSVIQAVSTFIESKQDLRSYKKLAKEKLCEYLVQQSTAGVVATLISISHVIRTILPPELVSQTDELESFLNGEEYKIPSEFFVHKNELKKFTKVNVETDEMQLKFNRAIVGTTVNAKVYYNKVGKTLTISNLSDKIIEKLDEDLAD